MAATKENADSPGAAARALMRACDRASLATAMVEGGWPFASLVAVALDYAGAPLLMISDLAEHAKNIKAARGRCALLFDGTAGHKNPLTGPRVTVIGRMLPEDDERLLARFIARHPDADAYAGFGDFHLYRMTVDRGYLVAGFGMIRWIERTALLCDVAGTAGLAAAEAEIVNHMNNEHRDAVQAYARLLLALQEPDWRMTGIDPEGIDLRADGRIARIAFDQPVHDPEEVRNTLVKLVKKARNMRLRPS
jgi:putative heme iron utilization protein